MTKKSPPSKKSTASKRQRIPPGIRYDVLLRANFRCQTCGVLAKNARLEIDHKVPVAKGGTNAIANLQVLCVSCNRGKAAKLKRVRKAKLKKQKPPLLVQ